MRAEPYRKHWQIKNPPVPTALRPNRLAAGMSYTASRSGHHAAVTGRLKGPEHDHWRYMMRLRMHGTGDVLAGGIKARHDIVSVTTYRLKRKS